MGEVMLGLSMTLPASGGVGKMQPRVSSWSLLTPFSAPAQPNHVFRRRRRPCASACPLRHRHIDRQHVAITFHMRT